MNMNLLGRTLRDIIILVAIALLFGLKIVARNLPVAPAETCEELRPVVVVETSSYEDVRVPVVVRRVTDLPPCTKLSMDER
jgi:hypothetical protein